MEHSENTRVKIPALVHLTRLGYKYLSVKNEKEQIHEDTNIFRKVFNESINRINQKELSIEETDKLIDEVSLLLDNDDLGKSFYKVLSTTLNGIKLVDFQNFNNNSFNVVTELTYKNGEDEFRPDIILLLNGMPLSFIEVKKPNNREGILAERERIYARFRNEKFRKFVNLTQMLVFSNNNEYEEESLVPVQGAFYATSGKDKIFFNCFREKDNNINSVLTSKSEELENEILIDTNYISIKDTPEYNTNLNENTPTNRILTSLFSKDRYKMFLYYGIVYVDKKDKNDVIRIEKHIMRYTQLFATLAIERKLNDGMKKGVIWHTQGSGKTELTYYNVKFLTDYYKKNGIIAKFYFVVDRLDLLKQASDEFSSRGLTVNKVNSKDEFIKAIQTTGEISNTINNAITVINIQKFSNESVVIPSDYNVKVQRIFIMDEAHRSYNPYGSFLGNLLNSDKESIKIALTGTPLIGDGYNTKDIFGDYIDTYYYNDSIKDGYTLKLIREVIETTYRSELDNILKELETLQGSFDKKDVYSHSKYVSKLTEYIVKDFKESRIKFDDNSIGGMIVCDTSTQARAIFDELKNKYQDLKVALILHDEDDKDTRTEEQNDFKKGNIDILVVYNMLLTGFDAPRLKKLYLGRIIKAHNLLQTLTRVNRPYKDYRYGYVVDFADIQDEFEKTNKAYFKELQSELGDEFEKYSKIFKSVEEIEKDIIDIKNKLFSYNTENLEEFTLQINDLQKKELYDVRKCLQNLKELSNLVKMFGYTDVIEKVEISKVNKLINEVSRRIDILNLSDSLLESENTQGLLNLALDKIEFNFRCISKTELTIADKFRDKLEKTRKELERNLDKKDPEWISLYEELKRVFKTKNIEELNSDEMNKNISFLDKIIEKIKNKNISNNRLIQKYENDVKFMRIHKRIKESGFNGLNDLDLRELLIYVKHDIDIILAKNSKKLNNPSFLREEIKMLVFNYCKNNNVFLSLENIKHFSNLILEEYIEERKQVG